MSDWKPVCAADELPVNGVRLANVAGCEVALFRLADGFFALDDRCTHGNASLSDGEVIGNEVECPFHGGRFDIRSGKACAMPCTVDARSHPCRVEGGQVLVALGAGGVGQQAQPWPTVQVEVAERTNLTPQIVSLRLVPVDGGKLPPYEPGSHVDLHLSDGVVRQYSLCCPRRDTGAYRIAVQRESASRGGSAFVHAKLHVGSRLRMGLPRNDFALAADGHHQVLLAGGIGITPLLSMAHALRAKGSNFILHHWVRTRSAALFTEELQTFGDQFVLHVDDEPATLPANLAQALPSAAAGRHLYVCGPRGFMEWVLTTARAAGWQEDQLHREYFAAAAAA